MHTNKNVSRRRFLKSSGALAGVSLLRVSAPSLLAITQAACSAKQSSAAFSVLGELEAADFAAIAARIIPTTDTPGATEAGVIYFFDNAFAAEMSWALKPARAGREVLNSGTARFSLLTEEQQDELLSAHASTDFFELLRITTIFGFFAMSKYGGNKDSVAWNLIGFEGHHGAWENPFGHYDAEYAREQSRGQ